jgi:hypothetical protein
MQALSLATGTVQMFDCANIHNMRTLFFYSDVFCEKQNTSIRFYGTAACPPSPTSLALTSLLHAAQYLEGHLDDATEHHIDRCDWNGRYLCFDHNGGPNDTLFEADTVPGASRLDVLNARVVVGRGLRITGVRQPVQSYECSNFLAPPTPNPSSKDFRIYQSYHDTLRHADCTFVRGAPTPPRKLNLGRFVLASDFRKVTVSPTSGVNLPVPSKFLLDFAVNNDNARNIFFAVKQHTPNYICFVNLTGNKLVILRLAQKHAASDWTVCEQQESIW